MSVDNGDVEDGSVDEQAENENQDPREAVDGDNGEETAVAEFEEDDDLDEFDEEDEEVEDGLEQAPEPEKGAYRVIGQGDFSMNMANRGADDPGDNTLSEPQAVCRFGEMLYISDRGNHRVLIWEQPPEEDGEPAGVLLGQEDYADCLENRGITTTLDEMTSGLGDENLEGFTISRCEDDTISQPAGLQVIDGKLYVVDSGNHRVLRWDTLPTEDGEPPGMVLGQDNLDDNEANRRGFVGSGSLFFPMGIHSGDDQHVFVADKDNHRVLIWNKIPFGDGWNADICLGQEGMDEREPNRGEFDAVTAGSLSFPTGVFFDAEGDRLFVVDQGNSRVLIWNKVPNDFGRPADVVIGQEDFVSREPNAGHGYRKPNEIGLYFPTDVVFGKTGLFISDTGNHRILYWKEVPTENGQPADLVFGQKTFYENRSNRGGDTSNATFNDPFGMYLEEEIDEHYDPEEDDEQEEATPFKLYIADRGNSRVVVWNELPNPPQSEEDQEDDVFDVDMDDPDTLIGDEDDDDDFFGDVAELEEGEETEEETSDETSSA
jgi:hypothetical protein